MYTRLTRRILNILTEHAVIDKIRRTRWPLVDFQLHQPGRNIIGQSLIARSIRFTIHQPHTQSSTCHFGRLTLVARALRPPHKQQSGNARQILHSRYTPPHNRRNQLPKV